MALRRYEVCALHTTLKLPELTYESGLTGSVLIRTVTLRCAAVARAAAIAATLIVLVARLSTGCRGLFFEGLFGRFWHFKGSSHINKSFKIELARV
jgi:hypothetical protein